MKKDQGVKIKNKRKIKSFQRGKLILSKEEHVYDRFKKLACQIYLFYKNNEEDYKEAIELSQKILKFNTDNICALHSLMLAGFANFRLKNRRKAFEIYERVQELFAENTNIQDNFSQLLVQEFDISYKDIIFEQKIIDRFENKLRSNQIEDSLYKNLAGSYHYTKNFTEAIKYYHIWLEKVSDNFESWFYLGEIYEEIEEWSNAIYCFEKATQIDPDDDKWLGIKEGTKNKINNLNRKLKKKNGGKNI